MSSDSQRCLVHRFTVVAELCPDQPQVEPLEPFPPEQPDA